MVDSNALVELLVRVAIYAICAAMAGGIGHFWALGIQRKNGPFELFAALRALGLPFACSYCMSYWISMIAFFLIAPIPALSIEAILMYLGGLLAAPGIAVWMMAFNGEIVSS